MYCQKTGENHGKGRIFRSTGRGFKEGTRILSKRLWGTFSKLDVPFEYYLLDTGHKGEESINGGMLKRQQPLAANNGVSGYVCALYVESIDQTLKKVRKYGGTVTMEKTQLPGIGHIAYGLDSEGNAFGLWEVV